MVMRADPNAPREVSRDRNSEIGVSGIKVFAGMVSEEFLPELQGDRGRRIYREMADNDPVVGGLLYVFEMIFRSLEPQVIPYSVDDETEPSQADLDAAQFVQECMNDMSMTWADFMSDLVELFPFGWAWFEVVYKERLGPEPSGTLPDGSDKASSEYDDGKIGWRKFAYRSQNSLVRWDVDPHGGVKGMWQRPALMGQELYMPIEKCLHFKTKHAGGNPEGRSILRSAYVPWYFRKNLQAMEGISLERMGIGIPVYRLPQDATTDDRARAQEQIRANRVDEQMGFTIEHDAELEIAFGQAGRAGQAFEVPIVRYRAEILMTVLAQFIALGMEKTGSYALSQTQRDIFQVALEGFLRSIEDVINRYAVTRLVRLNNFPGIKGMPKISLGSVGNIDLSTVVEGVSKLVPAGALVVDSGLKAKLRQLLGMPEEVPEEVEEPKPEPDDDLAPTGDEPEDDEFCQDCAAELDEHGDCPECDTQRIRLFDHAGSLPPATQRKVRARAKAIRKVTGRARSRAMAAK